MKGSGPGTDISTDHPEIGEFETCFERYFEMLHHYAYTIVKDSDEAKDIVQAAFLKLWALHKNLRIRHSIKSYLYRAVYNLSINHIRDRRVRNLHLSRARTPNEYTSGATQILEKEFAAALAREIDRLPTQCKIVFLKSRLEDKKNAAIALELGVTTKAVEAQITKALKILRENLAEYISLAGILILSDQFIIYG